MNTFARAHSLLIGATAAAITTTVGPALRGARTARRLAPLAAAGAVIIVLTSSQSSMWLFRWGFPTFAVAMGVVVVAAADGWGTRLLAARPMRWLGDRSYGIYLWHWPVILFLSHDRAPVGGLALDVVRIGISIALAAASYRWLETPIRRRRRLVARWSPAAALGALGASVGLVLVALPTSTSATAAASVVTLPPASTPPAPPPSTSASTAPWSTPLAAGGAATSTAPTTAPSSTTNVPATTTSIQPPTTGGVAGAASLALPLRVLVAGDSTALHLADALLPYAAAHPDQLVAGNASFPGCGLTAAADGRMHEFSNEDGSRELIDLSGCTGEWASVVERVRGDEHIDVVLVEIGAWDAVDIHLADGRVVSVADPVGRALVTAAYRSFVTEVEQAGARVVWVRPPDLHLGWGSIDAPVNGPARWTAMREVIDGLGVEQIDLPSWLTAHGLAGPEGRPDGVHLAPDVDQRFVQDLVAPTLVALAT
jgi:hypothetical protein